MKYKLIRHATVKLDFGGTCFLLDPWFAAKGKGLSYAGKEKSPLVDMPCKMWEAESRADCVVLSHLHSDHFDKEAADFLDKDRPLFFPACDAEAPLLAGFTDLRPVEGTGLYNEVAFEHVPGRHGHSEAVLADMGESGGYVFMAAGEPTLYWTGDTVWCEEVRKTIEVYQPQVIVVHGGGALWNGEEITMGIADVLSVCKAAPDAKVIAVHFETTDHASITRRQLREAADAAGISRDQLRIPADGEEIVIMQETAF